MCCILSAVYVCMQKIGEVEFCKHRVKIQIWGKPVIFLMSYVCK